MSAARSSSVPTAVLLGVLTLGLGCASSFKPKIEEPVTVQQWPYAPSEVITYARAITGFARGKGLGRALRAIAYGWQSIGEHAFVLPVAVATGKDGRIAVADMGRRSVHLYVPATRTYLSLTGSGKDLIGSPVGLAFDNDLRLYLSDSTGRLFAFDSNGSPLFSVDRTGGEKLVRPTGIAYSPDRNLLYLVDTLANKVYGLRAGTAELAFAFGKRGEEPGSFNFPTHICRAASGEIYISDSLNFRIQIFDQEGHYLGSFGHHGDGSGDLAMPKGIAVDRDGVIYVADGVFDNVQLFDRRGSFLLTLGHRGVGPGEFWLPSGAFIDRDDQLYICDTYNHRVQLFRLHGERADGV